MTEKSDWLPTAKIVDLETRSRLIQGIRHFFFSQGYLEVETPSLGDFGITDCYIKNIKAICNNKTYYLQTSPEYYMKRLLAAGSGPIFQIGKAFRDEEKGRWHQPEFTMLEFYQLAVDHLQLIEIISNLFEEICHWPQIKVITYQSLFEQHCGFNPHNVSIETLRHCLKQQNLQSVIAPDELNVDQYLFLLMAEVIEPHLSCYKSPIAIIDFPLSQAALAQIKDEKAQRFEIYYRGIELANGFHELTDPQEQIARFEKDNQLRKQQGKSQNKIDSYFIAALRHGLSPCSGVAIGIDRLIALYLGQNQIESVMSFAQS